MSRKMAGRKLLGLVVLCLTVSYIEYRGRSRGSSHSSHFRGKRSPSTNNLVSSSSNHSYPSSSSGLSGGLSRSHSYPPSSSTLSGSGSKKNPSSSSGSPPHKINNHINIKPTHKEDSHGLQEINSHKKRTRIRTRTRANNSSSTVPNAVPSFYATPQYVYIKEYRDSGSRYGDLLTGLTLYNLGRAHNSIQEHYYYDDYYTRRNDSLRASYMPKNKPKDKARCILKTKENEKVELLKIPCEIVSTFTQGSTKVALTTEMQVNMTVCQTKTTNITMKVPVSNSLVNTTVPTKFTNKVPVIGSLANSTLTKLVNHWPLSGSSVNPSVTSVTINTTIVNVTVCTNDSFHVDPLTVKGPPVDAKNMECVVEIYTKLSFLQQKIDCNSLMTYAKMPEPKKDIGILPSRNKLKSWLSKPPWWMTVFIAV